MKKIIYAFAIGLVIASCSVEEKEGLETPQNLTSQFSTDDSSLGVYKGVFSTIDSETRGTVEINLTQNDYAKATITLVSGEIQYATSNERVVSGSIVNNLSFSSTSVHGFSFNFSVEADGNNPILTDVNYKNVGGAISVLKETSRAPVVPVTGTYATNGGGPAGTFSMIFNTGDGSGSSTDITTQIMFNGADIGTAAGNSQSGCSVNFGNDSCTVDGASIPLGNGNLINWTGTHMYNTAGGDCSRISGTWAGEGGALTGTFIGDNFCTFTLSYENFEDTVTAYTPSIADDLTDIMNRDYFGIILPSSGLLVDIAYTNIQEFGFYGAQDTDGTFSGNIDTIELVWTDLDVSDYGSINVSGFFGEDDSTDGNEDWDTTSSVRLEYSFNNTTWNDLIAFESELGVDGNQTNELARQDTDFDTTGDGAEVTPNLTQYMAMFATGGEASVSIRIVIENLDSGDEDIAIDNILIEGVNI